MSQPDVRVRIAPSPTGAPHVGTAYIGLFNFVFAKVHGGKFVIRIEDTDRVRSTQRSEDAILRSLRWLGLDCDEGPDIGGPYGPYRQSERLGIYQEYVQTLIDNGAAYRCVCTSERLDAMRQQQRQDKAPIRYDGHCREASTADIDAAVQQGLPVVVRLKVPSDGVTVVNDAFREPISIDNAQTDDQILLKSDGYPTYHLANVVDDHLMQISHVIRAEEWISSTPKHLMLYNAFGWEPPTFMHMPLLRNTDKSKISKRKNPVSLEYYKRQGFLPEAMLNFLALLGWSMPDDQEIFTLEKMIQNFNFNRLSLGGPVFDLQKLDWINGMYLRQLSPEALADRLQTQIVQPKTQALSDPTYLQKVLPLLQERLTTLGDFHHMADYFYDSPLSYDTSVLVPKGRNPRETANVLSDVGDHLQRHDGPWTDADLEQAMRVYVEGSKWDNRSLFMALRVTMTGRTASPPLFATMEVLGRDTCLARLEDAVATLQK